MAYRDPYYSQQHYNANPYTDAPEFNPYSSRQNHPTYDQSGYRDADDDGAAPGAGEAFPNAGQTAVDHHDQGAGAREKSKYEEMFPPVFRPPECVFFFAY